MNRNRLLFYLGILWGLFIILHAADGILWLKPMPFPFPYVWEALCGLLLMAIFLTLLPIPRLPPRFGGMRGLRIRVFLIWQNIACIIGLLNPR